MKYSFRDFGAFGIGEMLATGQHWSKRYSIRYTVPLGCVHPGPYIYILFGLFAVFVTNNLERKELYSFQRPKTTFANLSFTSPLRACGNLCIVPQACVIRENESNQLYLLRLLHLQLASAFSFGTRRDHQVNYLEVQFWCSFRDDCIHRCTFESYFLLLMMEEIMSCTGTMLGIACTDHAENSAQYFIPCPLHPPPTATEPSRDPYRSFQIGWTSVECLLLLW